jgi:hypothetical protein
MLTALPPPPSALGARSCAPYTSRRRLSKLFGMDPRKWLPSLPLFGSFACVYCGGPADTWDHTPPRCLLPKPLPGKVQAMTVPACSGCNNGFSQDEMRTAAVVCTVSFTHADRVAVAAGGWVRLAMERDSSLSDFVSTRLGADGVFRADAVIIEVILRIMTKTAVGLLFHEFGRIVPLAHISLVAVEHFKNVHPSALAELHRRDDATWAEVTPTGRELERQVLACYGHEPPHMPKWRKYVPECFEYMFLRRSNDMLLTAMKLHDALTVLLECPWPSRAGPRRHGRPPKAAGGRESGNAGPESH